MAQSNTLLYRLEHAHDDEIWTVAWMHNEHTEKEYRMGS